MRMKNHGKLHATSGLLLAFMLAEGVYLPFMGSINKDKQNFHEYINIS